MSLFILDDMIVDESSDPHENKRVKITTACDTCRRRKVKCDGASPCANCQRGGYQCTFSDASTKRPRGPPKGFVALIEDRLHTIESLLVNLVNKDTNDIKEIKQETETPINETSERRNISTIKIRQYSPSNVITSVNSNNNPTQHLSIPTTPPADANSLSDVQYQPFVSSFGDDLTSDDEDAIQHNLASCTSSNLQNSALFLLHKPGSYTDPPLPTSLPQSNPLPQDVAKQLLEKYFTHFHPFFPIINRSQLLGQLSNPEDQPSPLLLNAIYAVGALYPPILQDSYSPLTFYERARNLLDFFVDAPRLSTVQALVLLCMVDQGRTSSYRPQTYSSMAIRMAQSMGLNRKYGAAYRQSKDLQTKKLVWWACFIIDRLHSLTTDDPLTINEKTCDIGLPSLDEMDDQQDPGQNLYNPSHAQRITVFLHFIRLTQVMGHIIGHLQSTACTGILYHNMISYYEAALTRWSSELPSYLQLPPTTGHNTPFSGQIAAIQMHYQNLRIMLYYPYLAQARNSRSSKTYLKSRDVCTTAANTITKIGVASLNNVYVCITFPTMFHCLAHAAKVHVFNITSAERGLVLSAKNNVFKTVEIFKFYVEHGVMAELANQTIKALENVLVTHRDKFVINNRVNEMTSQSSTATNTPILTSQIYPHPLGNDSVGPSTPNGIISMTNAYPPYSSPTSTHSGSPINPGSPKMRQTQSFTYVQPEEAGSQPFISVNNGMSATQYSPDELFESISTVNTSPSNMMSTNFSGMAPEGHSFLGLEMAPTQPNMVDFSGYNITSSPVNIGSVLTPSKHFQQLRYHASTPLSTSSSLSSSSSSSSMSFKCHRQSNHPSLDSIDDDLESEGALLRSALANNVR